MAAEYSRELSVKVSAGLIAPNCCENVPEESIEVDR